MPSVSPSKLPGQGRIKQPSSKPAALEFFAGSGLAGEGYKTYFRTVWANDNCQKKAATYSANHPPEILRGGSISDLVGGDLPPATLSWASFPCQDLSLAGNLDGIQNSRSGLVWEWLRIMDEMDNAPPILVAENVLGLLTSANGAHYRQLHNALKQRGYRTGAIVLDAKHWIPQSRPRVFIIAAKTDVSLPRFETSKPTWCHTAPVLSAAKRVKDFTWWNLPTPRGNGPTLKSIIDFDAPCDSLEKSRSLLSLIPPLHRKRLKAEQNGENQAFPAYRRTRSGKQVLELRFDGLAGCLRTPGGGSSRQFLVLRKNGRTRTRLLTIAETASLMGVRRSYKIKGSYNDGYKAMGDAVAVPAVRHLARHLLSPLATALATPH